MSGHYTNLSCQFFNVQMVPLCLEELNQPIHVIRLGIWAPGYLQLQFAMWVLLQPEVSGVCIRTHALYICAYEHETYFE